MDRRQAIILRKLREADRIRRERASAYLRMMEFEFEEALDERIDEVADKKFREGMHHGAKRIREQESESELISHMQATIEAAIRKKIGRSRPDSFIEGIATDITYRLAGHITQNLGNPVNYAVSVQNEMDTFSDRISVSLSLGSSRAITVAARDIWDY